MAFKFDLNKLEPAHRRMVANGRARGKRNHEKLKVKRAAGDVEAIAVYQARLDRESAKRKDKRAALRQAVEGSTATESSHLSGGLALNDLSKDEDDDEIVVQPRRKRRIARSARSEPDDSDDSGDIPTVKLEHDCSESAMTVAGSSGHESVSLASRASSGSTPSAARSSEEEIKLKMRRIALEQDKIDLELELLRMRST